MFKEILLQAWDALRRNPTRSLLTMLGVIWGIAAVTLLMSYGAGFRKVMLFGFNNFSRSVVIMFPGQTSEQAGGERAGRRIRFDLDDLLFAQLESPSIKKICPESINRTEVSWLDQVQGASVRGVCVEFGDIRSEEPVEGRWISGDDYAERRRVIFLGGWLRRKLFSGRPAIGEAVSVKGVRFTVIGSMDKRISFGNYYGPDDRAAFIPYTTASQLWDTRYPSNAVIQPIAPAFEDKAEQEFRAALGRRLNFPATDKRALNGFGTSNMRPIIDGLSIGLQVLLMFIGLLTLAIGGIGLMNILLVSVNERTREIGLRRALGARRWHVAWQFLAEALIITLGGGLIGVFASYAITWIVPPMPMFGALFEDNTGRGDLVLQVQTLTLAISIGVLLLVGILSGLVPAMRAARLDPTQALHTE